MKKLFATMLAGLMCAAAFAQVLYMNTPTYTGGGLGVLSHGYAHIGSYQAEVSLTAAYSAGGTTYNGTTAQSLSARYAVVFEAKPSGATEAQVVVSYVRNGSATATWASSGKREFYPYFYFWEGSSESPTWWHARNTTIAPPGDDWWFGFDSTQRTFTLSLSGSGPWSVEKDFGMQSVHILYGLVSPSSATATMQVHLTQWRYKINGSWSQWYEPEI